MDNQLYFFAADRVADGIPPHISLVDHKHALSTMLSGWATAAGRAAGVDGMLAPRCLSVATACASVAGLWFAALKLSGRRVHAHLSALTMLAFGDFFFQAAAGYRPKVFMVVFIVAALLAYFHRRFVTAGAVSAAAFLCWQPAGVVLAGLGAGLLPGPRPHRTVLHLAAGALVAVLAYQSYFFFHGVMGEQLYQTYGMHADVRQHRMPPIGESIDFLIALGLAHRDLAGRLIGVSFLVGLALGGLWVVSRPLRALRMAREGSPWIGFSLAAAGAVAFTMIDHQAYPDMFVLHPFIALGVGWLLVVFCDHAAGSQGYARLIRVPLLGLCMVTMAFAVNDRRDLFPVGGETRADQEAVAKHMDLLAEEHGPVWAIGCVHLLAYLHRDNHSKFGMLLDPRVAEYAVRSGNGSFLPLEKGVPPGVILVARSDVRGVVPWLEDRYVLRNYPMFRSRGINVWIRRDPA